MDWWTASSFWFAGQYVRVSSSASWLINQSVDISILIGRIGRLIGWCAGGLVSQSVCKAVYW